MLSYGVDQVDPFRRAATYVDRILRGEKPGDLPVQFPTKFEMVLNLKTAKALGLAIPREPPRSLNNCWLCRFMALRWHNLPCALKAAIGIGKRTLGDPGQSAVRRRAASRPSVGGWSPPFPKFGAGRLRNRCGASWAGRALGLSW